MVLLVVVVVFKPSCYRFYVSIGPLVHVLVVVGLSGLAVVGFAWAMGLDGSDCLIFPYSGPCCLHMHCTVPSSSCTTLVSASWLC